MKKLLTYFRRRREINIYIYTFRQNVEENIIGQQIAKSCRELAEFQNRALERAKTKLAEALAREAKKSDLTITIAGLRFAKVNLGTNLDHPLGRHYNDNGEADAAIPKGWRRPTEADYEQLYERTTRTPTERDGVKGLLFKDKETGVEMFMPCAGYITPDGRLEGVGEVGAYWSSSRHSTAYCSYGLYFNYDGGVNPSGADARSTGMSVRCVLSE